MKTSFFFHNHKTVHGQCANADFFFRWSTVSSIVILLEETRVKASNTEIYNTIFVCLFVVYGDHWIARDFYHSLNLCVFLFNMVHAAQIFRPLNFICSRKMPFDKRHTMWIFDQQNYSLNERFSVSYAHFGVALTLD